jgi:hypothetical protein
MGLPESGLAPGKSIAQFLSHNLILCHELESKR